MLNVETISGFCVKEKLQPGQYSRVRVVRGHVQPDQVYLAVSDLPAPVLPGQEAGADEGGAPAEDSEGDCSRPHAQLSLAVLSLECEQPLHDWVSAQPGSCRGWCQW